MREANSQSYDKVYNSRTVRTTVDSFVAEVDRRFREATKGRRIVGVVVAYGGEVAWSDVFASDTLFARYWPKLLRSYVVEAMSGPVVEHAVARRPTAEQFLYQAEGKQIIEVEPGEYRLIQIDHPRYSVFQLASLLEKSEPLLHFNKLRKESWKSGKGRPGPIEPLGVDIQPVQRRD